MVTLVIKVLVYYDKDDDDIIMVFLPFYSVIHAVFLYGQQ